MLGYPVGSRRYWGLVIFLNSRKSKESLTGLECQHSDATHLRAFQNPARRESEKDSHSASTAVRLPRPALPF